MRRLLISFVVLFAAALAVASTSLAAGSLRVQVSASKDFTRVTYSVKNTSRQPVKAGTWVLFGSNTVTVGLPVPKKPVKLMMNGLPQPDSVMDKYFKVKLPGVQPGQTIRFYAIFRKEDVRPVLTCHYILQWNNLKNFDRACNAPTD